MYNTHAMDRDALIDAYVKLLTPAEREEAILELVEESTDINDILFNLVFDSRRECYETEWLRNVVDDMVRETYASAGIVE